ncbi:MAG: response regulator transcription factor [Pseudarcicella sp.]|jgi:two-component system alkaline phosphatase synthesis response regulator PhoP|nr:response regulator transcription factor [Pseudarcicella sp.]MBP6410105.1 response regulator transcription factor [Pseudarcicella sp.]
MSALKVLIVDDDPDIVELLAYNLNKDGYHTRSAEDGEVAMKVALEFVPDIILMDVMMPKQDGIETARRIKQLDSLKDCYIVFLTARTEEYTEVAAFEVGANDYITKPIKPRALMSRIRAISSRNKEVEDSKAEQKFVIQTGEITVDKSNYTLRYLEKTTPLPRKEFELLWFFAKSPNKVHSRDEILDKIWGSDVLVVERTIDVHIRKIREKIPEHYIKTLKGVGYLFSVD